MIDGLMKLVESDGGSFDVEDYQVLRVLLKKIEPFYALQVVPMPMMMAPGTMHAGTMAYVCNADSDYQAEMGLRNQIRGRMESLIAAGWGHLPEVETQMMMYLDRSLPIDYKGVRVSQDLASIYYPTKKDIDNCITVDGRRSYIVGDMLGNAAVVRRRSGSINEMAIEVLADETGRYGLEILPHKGFGYTLAAMIGLDDFVAPEPLYRSKGNLIAAPGDMRHFDAALKEIESR
jgi:hypothetical protein